MNYFVKTSLPTPNFHLNSPATSAAAIRSQAYAWHLNTHGCVAACQVIFDTVADGRTGAITAPVQTWVSAHEWIGLRILLGHMARFARVSNLDETEIFNRLAETWWERTMTLCDGRHLHRTLIAIAKNRRTDVLRQQWRSVLLEDWVQQNETTVEDHFFQAPAMEQFISHQRQMELDRVVRAALAPHPEEVADQVFHRYIEMEGSITQQELAEEFQLTQCKVCRILKTRLAALRVALEEELGHPLNMAERKPRRRKGAALSAVATSAAVQPLPPEQADAEVAESFESPPEME